MNDGRDELSGPGVITDFKITEGYVRCSRCGARCSPDVKVKGDYGLVVRAWVECPECLEKEPDHDPRPSLFRAALEEIATRKTAALAKHSAEIARAALDGRNFFAPPEDVPEGDRYGQ